MGVDANLAPSANLQINSYLAKTETPGRDGNDMAFYGRIAYRDPKWNLWLNYLDVQDNFNAEAGFVQRTGIRTTKGYFSPTPRPKTGRVKLFEPMYVLTYTTDQTNRLVYRNHHLMLGTTLRDDTFINVFYQKTLDVLDVPFRIRPDVTIPAGLVRHARVVLHGEQQPGQAHLRARDGVAGAVLRRHAAEPVGGRGHSRHQPVLGGSAIQPQRRARCRGAIFW